MSRERARQARQVGILTAIPFILLAGPLAGYLAGSWLDRRFGTAPLILIVLILLGFVGAARETYRLIQLASREDVGGEKPGQQRDKRGSGVPGKNRPRERP
jgi:F0F1-type ATP synthase assembly protein I